MSIKSYDGLDLHGWACLAGISPKSESIEVNHVLTNGRPVVLFFPGNAGNRSMRYLQLSLFGSLKAHAVIFDYRGYADNAGSPSEVDMAKDARSIWNYLTKNVGVSPQRIVIYGESLGGGVGNRLASELCLEGIEPGGIISQSTFSSLVATAQAHFPLIPVSMLLLDRFPSDQRIKHVTCPILQIHGKRDSIVPFEIGQKLFQATPEKSSRGIAKKLLVLPDADHNDVYSSAQDPNSLLVAELRAFLEAAGE